MQGLQPTLLKRRRTKIVATLGPASTDASTIERLIAAGVNVFRLNFSHGDHETHAAAYKQVRTAAANAGVPIAVLADLCGPKIRVDRFEGGRIDLVDGDTVTVTTRAVLGRPGLIPSQYEALADDVHPGCRILLADGMLALRVEDVDGTEIRCTVVHGGVLKDRKGMNLPDVPLSTPALTAKDKDDARFAADLGVDYFALSFVRRAQDVEDLKALLGDTDRAHIIAKIEHPLALENIDAIIDAADGLMVARGDLGVELPPEVVPVVQRELVARARAKAKPSIVATQMLESMIENPQPTRAEVSDVSTAVFSSADAVMLSAETASGQHPVRAVEMMDRIARQVEGYLWGERGFRVDGGDTPVSFPVHEAVARSTAQLSRDLGVRGIVVFSTTGTTARVLAAARPAAPLLAATNSPRALLSMALLWGVEPQLVEAGDLEDRRAAACRLAEVMGLAGRGQRILSVAGFGHGGDVGAPAITVLTL